MRHFVVRTSHVSECGVVEYLNAGISTAEHTRGSYGVTGAHPYRSTAFEESEQSQSRPNHRVPSRVILASDREMTCP